MDIYKDSLYGVSKEQINTCTFQKGGIMTPIVFVPWTYMQATKWSRWSLDFLELLNQWCLSISPFINCFNNHSQFVLSRFLKIEKKKIFFNIYMYIILSSYQLNWFQSYKQFVLWFILAVKTIKKNYTINFNIQIKVLN